MSQMLPEFCGKMDAQAPGGSRGATGDHLLRGVRQHAQALHAKLPSAGSVLRCPAGHAWGSEGPAPGFGSHQPAALQGQAQETAGHVPLSQTKRLGKHRSIARRRCCPGDTSFENPPAPNMFLPLFLPGAGEFSSIHGVDVQHRALAEQFLAQQQGDDMVLYFEPVGDLSVELLGLGGSRSAPAVRFSRPQACSWLPPRPPRGPPPRHPQPCRSFWRPAPDRR